MIAIGGDRARASRKTHKNCIETETAAACVDARWVSAVHQPVCSSSWNTSLQRRLQLAHGGGERAILTSLCGARDCFVTVDYAKQAEARSLWESLSESVTSEAERGSLVTLHTRGGLGSGSGVWGGVHPGSSFVFAGVAGNAGTGGDWW